MMNCALERSGCGDISPERSEPRSGGYRGAPSPSCYIYDLRFLDLRLNWVRSRSGDAASASRAGAAKGRSGILSASSEKDAVQN